jgi:hypothetical protein
MTKRDEKCRLRVFQNRWSDNEINKLGEKNEMAFTVMRFFFPRVIFLSKNTASWHFMLTRLSWGQWIDTHASQRHVRISNTDSDMLSYKSTQLVKYVMVTKTVLITNSIYTPSRVYIYIYILVYIYILALAKRFLLPWMRVYQTLWRSFSGFL